MSLITLGLGDETLITLGLGGTSVTVAETTFLIIEGRGESSRKQFNEIRVMISLRGTMISGDVSRSDGQQANTISSLRAMLREYTKMTKSEINIRSALVRESRSRAEIIHKQSTGKENRHETNNVIVLAAIRGTKDA